MIAKINKLKKEPNKHWFIIQMTVGSPELLGNLVIQRVGKSFK